MREELGLIPGKLDEVRAAWDLQTKQMIFDLAAQRLAMDGLTTEELTALAGLAGPQGFGLIDDAGQTMIEVIGLAAEAMDQGRIDAEGFNDILKVQQSAIGDVNKAFEDLITDVENYGDQKIKIQVEWDLGEIPSLRGRKLLEFDDMGFSRRQAGGRLTGLDIVGERGAEMIIGNQVVPADQTSRFLKTLSNLTKVPSDLFNSRRSTVTPSPAYNSSQSTTTYGDENYNLTIHTSAPYEPIAADFRTMKAMGSRI